MPSEAPRPPSPNLLLAGFMGTGKSALGRQLAKRWRRPFVDTDEVVEHLAGMTIPEIFEKHGEARFRELEREVVTGHLPASGAVIACGGGLVIPEGMAELVRSKGVVICLFASVETILRRTAGNSRRPLLKAGDLEERIRQLMRDREQAYLRAGVAVYTDGRSLQQLCDIVTRVYDREARALMGRRREG